MPLTKHEVKESGQTLVHETAGKHQHVHTDRLVDVLHLVASIVEVSVSGLVRRTVLTSPETTQSGLSAILQASRAWTEARDSASNILPVMSADEACHLTSCQITWHC